MRTFVTKKQKKKGVHKQNTNKWPIALIITFSFLFTLLNLLSYTTLIGDDAAWHLEDSLQTIKKEPLRIGYPILFRSLLSPILKLTGTKELPKALIIIKILASTATTLSILATYLFVKRIFNYPTAILTAFLLTISPKNMQMLSWGGLPNYFSLTLYPISLYLLSIKDKEKTQYKTRGINIVILFTTLCSFLFHYWSGAILITIFSLYYLTTLKRTRKNLSLAILIILTLLLLINFKPIKGTLNSVKNHTILNCTTREILIHLNLIWNGILNSLSLGTNYPIIMPILTGIGLMLLIHRLEVEEERKPYLILISWLTVPLLLLTLITYGTLRERLLYFLVHPTYILISIATISILRNTLRAIKLLTLFLNNSKKTIGTHLLPLALTTLFTLALISGGYGSMKMIKGNLQLFYPDTSKAIINSINWTKETTPQNSTIITTTWSGPPWQRGPSRWMLLTERNAQRSLPIISDLTMEITTETLRIYEGIHNQKENPHIQFYINNPFSKGYQTILSFTDSQSILTYNNSEMEVIAPLSEYQERIIQLLNKSTEELWIISHTKYQNFNITKSINLQNNRSIIRLYYNITTQQSLEEAKLTLHLLISNVTFNKVLLPGVLEWASPWNNPTNLSKEENWATITTTSKDMTQNLIAYTNQIDNTLTVLKFDENQVQITINATKEGGIKETTLTFPLGTIQENQTTSIKIQLGLFNLHSRWKPITLEKINRLLKTTTEPGKIEVKGLKETLKELTTTGPVYVISQDEYLSPDFPNYTLFNRIYANNHITAYQAREKP